MKLLRRLLKVQAALWLLWSLAIGLFPRWVMEDLFGQPVLADYVWVRAAAVMGVAGPADGARRSEDRRALVVVVGVRGARGRHRHRVRDQRGLRRARGADAWPFWALASVNGAFGAGLLVGMGIGGQEKPFV